ncbi:MAG: hypothetical protein Kow001_09410 [Acidobacteriota bacterium]
MAPTRDRWTLVLLGVLSFAPDLDFVLVVCFGLPLRDFHRTWSHSLPLALAVALLWGWFRPRRFAAVSGPLVFAVLASHGAIDLLCTADAADHGVMWFWPLDTTRFGWPVLVPLYRLLADSPFTAGGALLFTLLELVLAGPLWIGGRVCRDLCRRLTAG